VRPRLGVGVSRSARSRVSARTVCPSESSRGASSEPTKPEAPVTRMRMSIMMMTPTMRVTLRTDRVDVGDDEIAEPPEVPQCAR
jgi:hypothetical protein